MKTKNEQANFCVIFRTGKLWEYDMAINILNENGIPNQSREETSGGLCLAIPLCATPSPGTWWSVLVPKKKLDQAKHILSELPMEIKTDPDIWDFSSSEKVKRGQPIYLWISLGLGVLWVIFEFIQTLKK